MQRATLTSKGQTTIPVAVRKKLGLEPGDQLLFEERDGGFSIRRAPGTASLAGLMDGKIERPLVSVTEEKEVAAQGWVEGAMQGMGGAAESKRRAG